MAGRKRVLLLHTGGTLGMSGARPSPLKPGRFTQTLRREVPELWRLADVELEIFSNIDSSDMRPALWSRLAERVFAALSDFDGVVITHGTDTMAWTASALSFMLRGLKKPVVLTGSQRPLSEVRNDARLNLIDAVTAAVSGPAEVSVCFDSRLLRGNRTRKVKINEYDAFESPNFPPLGHLGVDIVFEKGRASREKPAVLPKLEEHVFLLKVFPGMPPSVARAILPGLKGLVVEAFGAGNVPIVGSASLVPLFDDAKALGIPVVIVSQSPHNSVDLSLYESGAAAMKRGAIGGGDMTPEAAVTKMMHVLANAKDARAVRAMLEQDLAGERTVA